jgi:dTDP-4-dehydrorhamnose 3,5-epimerase
MSARFDIIGTPLAGLVVLQRKPIGDARGFLERLYCADELSALFGGATVQALNRTHTAARGTVRGMHFQHAPHAEDKLITCLRGEVLDVVVDVRRGSPTFLEWHAETLSDANHRSLLVPKGFAHGFQTLTEDCEMLYLHTAAHHPASEAGLDALDPRLKIDWLLPVTERSVRDQSHPHITEAFTGIDS